MAKLAVHDIKGKETGSVQLPDEIFTGKVNEALLHQAVVMYLANQRQGTVNTKTRGEVSGGGKKPWRQKGTGRARAGSSRSPLWHKGGIVFGPHPRNFSYSLSKKTRIAALRASLNAKYQAQEIVCVEDIKLAKAKTKEVASILKAFKLRGKVLALLDGTDNTVVLASRNIRFLSFTKASDINAYDVLKNKTVLVTKSAIENLLKRIQ